MSTRPPLNPEEYQRFSDGVTRPLEDYADGFAVVGFHPQTGEPFIFKRADDPKTSLALNALLMTAANMPVMVQKPGEG